MDPPMNKYCEMTIPNKLDIYCEAEDMFFTAIEMSL